MNVKKKIVLAFSGGLDTTYCAIYLSKSFGEVHTITVNTAMSIGVFDASFSVSRNYEKVEKETIKNRFKARRLSKILFIIIIVIILR